MFHDLRTIQIESYKRVCSPLLLIGIFIHFFKVALEAL